MRRPRKAITARALPDTTLRRLRNTPSYFFLVWRWSTWLYALITIGSNFSDYSDDPTYSIKKLAIVLLSITFVQTLAVTLYTPVIQIIVPRLPVLNTLAARRRPPAEDEEADLLTPLARTSNPYWDIAVLCSDVFICGLVMYYGGAITSNPPFGDGSPFYRYGFSTVYAAAFSYRYRGSLAAAIGYDLFAVYGMFVFPPGTSGNYKVINATDVAGSLMDAPIVAVLSAYVVTLLARYTSSKREQQANVRRQRALLKVNEIILREANNRPLLLQKVAEQLRQGGHFQRLVIAMVNATSGTGGKEQQHTDALLGSCIEVSISDTQLPAVNQAYIEQVLRSQQRLVSFELFKESPGEERGIARLYLPFYREGQIQMIIGAESWRQTPFDSKQENFLVLAGAQLLLALDNIRLTEQTVELAATAERGRIAREIHDGIAQLTYMLSLNAETCATQARRIAEASEEDGELIIPLAQRLEKMVTVSKQALWET
ncbi:MAG: histidine kinase dimerization/phosphoacceptor domain-containing protein, partial [Ktedonobacteraceae bacterium]|nr:histidine kinase dimerization/phosphoacceptor domain-containing protein [Ktedonobacteraceae bacterium]